MAYKDESIRKMLRNFKALMDVYNSKDVSDVALCVSNGNRKIGRVMNVSLPPVVSCGNCGKCMRYCYDIKACMQYPNTVADARVRNWVLLSRDRGEYFARIEERIRRRRRNKYFRWHVSGDIVDRDYFARMVAIAYLHQDVVFWTYTKMYGIVNSFIADGGRIPENLHVMFSEWDGVEMVNPYGMPEFTCKLKDGNRNHAPEYFDSLYKCPGNCDICKECGRGCLAGETTYADEH